jgi:hypothetical protein
MDTANYVIQVIIGGAGAGLALYFLKRFVSEFDGFKKSNKEDFKVLEISFKNSVNEINKNIVSLNKIISEVDLSTHKNVSDLKSTVLFAKFHLDQTEKSVKMMDQNLGLINKNLEEAMKKSKIYDEVLRKMIHEFKNIKGDIQTLKVSVGKDVTLFKGDK